MMYIILLGAGLVFATGQNDPELPNGSPAEQVAAIRARLEAARTEYVRKFEKATTTAERDRLMKDVPRPEPYAERMLRVAARSPNDPAALDALLWVVGNTPPGDNGSPNTKAKAAIAKDYADSDRLVPFAVALSWSVSSADEDALRRLLARNRADRVQASATYALARQLIAQAEMIELHQVRLDVAATDEAKRRVKESLDTDFGRETADRLRGSKSKSLTDEAEKLLVSIETSKQYAALEWPAGPKPTRLGEMAKRDLEVMRALATGRPAPATEGTNLAGDKLSLAGYRGKTVLLTFTGHWCVACRGLYPLERELSKKHATRPFTVFGVNSDASRDLVKEVVAAEKMTWPLVWDGGGTEGPLASRWNVSGWPLVVLIDHEGVIRYKFRGAPEPAILTPLVDRLVGEAEAAGRGKVPAPAAEPGPPVERVDEFVRAKQKHHKFNGNVLIAEKGRVVYHKSFGDADFDKGIPLSERSVFNLASVSKPFTAFAVLLCRERRLLSLDDPLAKYFPELPYPGVTLRHMLTHTSGLPEQNELLYKHWDSDRYVTNPDMIALLVKHKPAAASKPGQGFKYCNTNYSLLASVVEKVSGQGFPAFLAKEIFEPAGMTQTYLFGGRPDARKVPDLTANYLFDAEKNRFSLPQDIPQWKKAIPVTGLTGAGNVHSTALDLFKWREWLKTQRVLPQNVLAEMEQIHADGSVDGSDGYGYGFAIKSAYGDTLVFHNGGTLGYWNSCQYYKKADRLVVVLSNNDCEKGLASALAAIRFGQRVVLPAEYREVELAADRLARFAGTYQNAGGRGFSIEVRGGKLYRVVPGTDPKLLKAASDTTLFYDDDSDRQVEFVFDAAGVRSVAFISQGIVTELTKAK